MPTTSDNHTGYMPKHIDDIDLSQFREVRVARPKSAAAHIASGDILAGGSTRK